MGEQCSRRKMEFSVLMSVYHKEKPKYLDEAINSIVSQVLSPDEIVLIKDGPLPYETEKVIGNWKKRLGPKLKIISLKQNVGLGRALTIGLQRCRYEIVGRMDTDDICDRYRFKKQIEFLESDPHTDVVGSWIAEFDSDSYKVVGIRKVPLSHKEISKKILFRNPMNHMSVMFRKSSVITVGAYEDLRWCQDYQLWIRMLLSGCRFANLPELLVYVRTGKPMYARRGGCMYLASEIKLQRFFLRTGLLPLPIFVFNVCVRLIVRFIPNEVRKCVYEKFLRDKGIKQPLFNYAKEA